MHLCVCGGVSVWQPATNESCSAPSACYVWVNSTWGACSDTCGSGTRVVYVSPIKALAYDVERNLRAPLAGLQRLGAGGAITVDVRTGDTPAKERERQRKDPGQILITTPESLYLLLAGRSRGLQAVVVAYEVEFHLEADTAGVRADQAGHGAQEAGLARAVGARQRTGLAGSEPQRDAGKQRPSAPRQRKIGDDEHP